MRTNGRTIGRRNFQRNFGHVTEVVVAMRSLETLANLSASPWQPPSYESRFVRRLLVVKGTAKIRNWMFWELKATESLAYYSSFYYRLYFSSVWMDFLAFWCMVLGFKNVKHNTQHVTWLYFFLVLFVVK